MAEVAMTGQQAVFHYANVILEVWPDIAVARRRLALVPEELRDEVSTQVNRQWRMFREHRRMPWCTVYPPALKQAECGISRG